MGNMSHPCINRWGSNTFWKTLWYSDYNYSNNVKYDLLFENLIISYLSYGLETTQPFFTSSFWYNAHNKLFKKEFLQKDQLYFRSFSKWDDFMEEQIHYNIRIKKNNMYLMRIWILKYNHWLLFNIYWFQPLKKPRKKRIFYKTKNIFQTLSIKNFTKTRRLKLLFAKIYFFEWGRRLKYIF